jgi:hypothetical protein
MILLAGISLEIDYSEYTSESWKLKTKRGKGPLRSNGLLMGNLHDEEEAKGLDDS